MRQRRFRIVSSGRFAWSADHLWPWRSTCANSSDAVTAWPAPVKFGVKRRGNGSTNGTILDKLLPANDSTVLAAQATFLAPKAI